MPGLRDELIGGLTTAAARYVGDVVTIGTFGEWLAFTRDVSAEINGRVAACRVLSTLERDEFGAINDALLNLMNQLTAVVAMLSRSSFAEPPPAAVLVEPSWADGAPDSLKMKVVYVTRSALRCT